MTPIRLKDFGALAKTRLINVPHRTKRRSKQNQTAVIRVHIQGDSSLHRETYRDCTLTQWKDDNENRSVRTLLASEILSIEYYTLSLRLGSLGKVFMCCLTAEKSTGWRQCAGRVLQAGTHSPANPVCCHNTLGHHGVRKTTHQLLCTLLMAHTACLLLRQLCLQCLFLSVFATNCTFTELCDTRLRVVADEKPRV